jgi:hypothetical protein
MPDRQLPERDPDITPQIDTPVIDMQDLEHKPNRETRVNNAGIRIKPHSDEHLLPGEAMFAREDEKAREAIEKFERELKSLPPD